MVEKKTYKFEPDYVSPPSATLLEVLDGNQLTIRQFAEKTQLSSDVMDQIIRNDFVMTEEVASRFEQVLGVSAKFWMNRDRNYRKHLTRIHNAKTLDSNTSQIAAREMNHGGSGLPKAPTHKRHPANGSLKSPLSAK